MTYHEELAKNLYKYSKQKNDVYFIERAYSEYWIFEHPEDTIKDFIKKMEQ